MFYSFSDLLYLDVSGLEDHLRSAVFDFFNCQKVSSVRSGVQCFCVQSLRDYQGFAVEQKVSNERLEGQVPYLKDRYGKRLNFNPDMGVIVETGFDKDKFIEIFLSYLLFLSLNQRILPVHGSTIAIDGEGTMLSGMGGAGKTRLLLNYILNGAGYVSDDWTLYFEGSFFPLKRKILICDYDITAYDVYDHVSLIDKARFGLGVLGKKLGVNNFLARCRLSLKGKEFLPERIFERVVGSAMAERVYFIIRSDVTEPKILDENHGVVSEWLSIFERENTVFLKSLNISTNNEVRSAGYWLERYKQRYKALSAELMEKVDVKKLYLPLTGGFFDSNWIRQYELDNG